MRKVLGEGQYGITREAKRRGGGEVFAVKTISKKKNRLGGRAAGDQAGD